MNPAERQDGATRSGLERAGGALVVTWEQAAYVGIVCLGIVLRMVRETEVLDPWEAARAMPAWLSTNGQATADASAIAGPALQHHLLRLAFWLFDGQAWSARLPAAIAGLLLVLAAWRLRDILGRAGALASAALFGISPLWIWHGSGLSALPLVGVVALLAADAFRARRPTAAAVWSGTGVALLGWSLIPALAAGIVFIGTRAMPYTRGRPVDGAGPTGPTGSDGSTDAPVAEEVTALEAPTEGEGAHVTVTTAANDSAVAEASEGSVPRPRASGPRTRSRQRATVVLLVTAVLGLTGLLTRPEYLIAGIGGGSGAWLRELTSGGGLGPFGGFLLPLAVYAPLTAVFGVAGLAMLAARRGRNCRTTTWLIAWALLAAVLGLSIGHPRSVDALLVPLTLGAGYSLGRLGGALAASFRWSEEGVMTWLVLIVGAYGLLHANVYAATGRSAASTTGDPLKLVYGSIGLVSVLAIAVWLLWGRALLARVLGTSAAIGLGLLATANGTWLLLGDQPELLRTERAEPGAELLREDLRQTSWMLTRDPEAMTVAAHPDLREPALEWLLRDRRDLMWVDPGRVGDDRGTDGRGYGEPLAALIPGNRDPAELIELGSGGWSGRSYTIASTWRPEFLDLQGFLRWYLQRGSGSDSLGLPLIAPEEPLEVQLFLRAP